MRAATKILTLTVILVKPLPKARRPPARGKPMLTPLFYTPLAESAKVIFYAGLAVLVIVGLWRKLRASDPRWSHWIHAAILLHFVVGGAYSGARMLTTSETSDMLIRRIFAWEAWFNFACAAFYFLVLTRTAPRRPT